MLEAWALARGINVVRISTSEFDSLAADYGVDLLPLTMILKGGHEIVRSNATTSDDLDRLWNHFSEAST